VVVGGRGPFLERLDALGIPRTRLDALHRSINPIHDIRAVLALRSTLEDLRPDIVATHSSKAGTLGRLAARTLCIPVTFTAHGWAFTTGVSAHKALVYRNVERASAILADRIITVSDFDRRLAIRQHVASSKKLVTIHNGVPDQSLALASTERSPPRIIMVARFDHPKDQPLVLKALSSLRHISWNLEFIGDGPLIDESRVVCKNLELEGRVSFLGWRDDVPERLAAAQLFVLASDFEGFPLSILEAMRAGLPVVATDVGGVREAVIEETNGLLSPRGDADRMRASFERLLRSPDLRARLGTGSRRLYEKRFTFERTVQRTLEVYAAAAATHGA
jgi:glycosyltransferase involved in cell wall biosynthesis